MYNGQKQKPTARNMKLDFLTFKDSQDQGLGFLPEYLNNYHLQYYKDELDFEVGKI